MDWWVKCLPHKHDQGNLRTQVKPDVAIPEFLWEGGREMENPWKPQTSHLVWVAKKLSDCLKQGGQQGLMPQVVF